MKKADIIKALTYVDDFNNQSIKEIKAKNHTLTIIWENGFMQTIEL